MLLNLILFSKIDWLFKIIDSCKNIFVFRNGFWVNLDTINLLYFNTEVINLLLYFLKIIIIIIYVSFNIILLNYFNNFFLILPLFICVFYSWFFFLKNNFSYIRLTPSYSDNLTQSNILKKYNAKLFINFSFIIFLFYFLHFFFIRGYVQSFWLNHNYLNNFNLNLSLLILILLIISYSIFLNTKHQNLVVNNDYYFSLLNISIFLPYLFFSNSLFNFLFILEVISILIFYKFVVSKFWFNEKFSFFKKTNILERIFSRNYINVLFFQYWVNFFSSVVLIISIINIMYIYGSTDWFFLNLTNTINNNIIYSNDLEFNVLLWVSFFICFFLKVGLTPAHLFKIEIYKGIPFISIFFYTTFYFMGYFIFLTLFVQIYINSFKIFFYFFFIIFLILGFIYTLFLLFDVSFTKAFFAYSTVVNSLAFISLLITIL